MAKNGDSYLISSKSRTKLNAFRYEDNVERSPEKSPSKSPSKLPSKTAHANKENQSLWLNGVVGQNQQPDKGQSSTQTAEPKSAKECPQTPGNRLPLADLISNAEDAFNHAPGQEFTPEEHVIWQHVPVSSNTTSISQRSATRGKKRRHSSSPSSSPLADNSKHAQEPLDMQSFQALLRTPQNDLATDLWNNYVGKSTLNGDAELPPPRLPNLLSSSPQTPASGTKSRDSSGLRRSISCNAEWPTSKSKRRRVNEEGSRTGRNIFARSRSNVLDSGGAKTASLKSFIERVESLQKAPEPRADPTNSSPVPARASIQRNRSMSPIEEQTALKAEKESEQDGTKPKVLRGTTPQGSSSEFEDDDLDLHLLEFTNPTLNSSTEPTQSHGNPMKPDFANEPSSKESQQSFDVKDPNPDMRFRSTTTGANDKAAINDVDEFDDDGDYELPENIQMILDGYDKASFSTEPGDRSASKPAAFKQAAIEENAEPSKEPEKSLEASSGDEFDDEDFDLEAIEQSMKQSGEDGPNHVCHS